MLDGCSRFIVHWELRESMAKQDVEIILQKALEQCPEEKPRIISDNGPQFIANDFKQFIRMTGITHVRTSPYYPQSNGKLERWHGRQCRSASKFDGVMLVVLSTTDDAPTTKPPWGLKQECIRPTCPSTLDEARNRVATYVEHYCQVRLHSAIGYITPADKLNGLQQVIFDERDRKLEEARQRRQLARQKAGCVVGAV
ncbi:MAG: transposase family protein, partial [Planctomycetaceae bacterium]|nr:transposase family protein [Planctomycetaceae bacterium]